MFITCTGPLSTWIRMESNGIIDLWKSSGTICKNVSEKVTLNILLFQTLMDNYLLIF